MQCKMKRSIDSGVWHVSNVIIITDFIATTDKIIIANNPIEK